MASRGSVGMRYRISSGEGMRGRSARRIPLKDSNIISAVYSRFSGVLSGGSVSRK